MVPQTGPLVDGSDLEIIHLENLETAICKSVKSF